MANKYFVVSAYGGRQSIIVASNLLQAEARARRAVGSDNFQSVALATETEIAWQQAMGGYLPPLNEGAAT